MIEWGSDLFELLCETGSEAEGWTKITKAMEVHGGCVVHVATRQKNPDGSYAISEAITFVPNVRIGYGYYDEKRLVMSLD